LIHETVFGCRRRSRASEEKVSVQKLSNATVVNALHLYLHDPGVARETRYGYSENHCRPRCDQGNGVRFQGSGGPLNAPHDFRHLHSKEGAQGCRTGLSTDEDFQLHWRELEENVKRKDLSWQEQVLAKKRLLEIMVAMHGEARAGEPSTMQRLGASPVGFGVNKLAAMLGESNAATSRDLELARLITAVHQLAQADTKEAARR
jgi:hypothetical protein